MTLLQLTNVTKSFAGVQALKGVSFELHSGEVHALVGENGAGKSTLIKIITGAELADAGSLVIHSRPVVHNDPVKARALGIAAIYQQPALFPDLTVAENIAFGLEPAGWRLISWHQRRTRARQLLDRIGARMDPDAEVGTLSMPEQQLVEIARALGTKAGILILDEPTASLSEREVENLFRALREIRAEGAGILYISHRLEELYQIGDRVTVLRDGMIVGTHSLAEVSHADLVRMMVGRELAAIFPKVALKPGPVILEITNLGCRQVGIQGVSLNLRAGEILGMAGLVGAGRTELARILFGITPADRGEILVRGKPVTIDNPRRAIELGIAYVPEDRRRHGVILDMSVAANTTLAVPGKIVAHGWLDQQRERTIASTFVDRLAIKTASLAAPAVSLSGGNQQKVALARWLATEPSVLILDEPTQGIDVGAKTEIHRLMGELAAHGMAILMISSELEEILGMSDRIAVMRGGTLVDILDRAESTQEKIMRMALGHGEYAT